MTPHSFLALLGLLFQGSSSMAGTPGDAVVMRDAAHHDIRFARPPQRLVTLMPSLTETVCALGACARLVGTDRYSNWPDSVRQLPKAGGLDDAEIELIVGLEPDVVILAHSGRVTERLRQLGLVTFEVKTERYADIARTVTALGQLLGEPQRAAMLNRDLEESVNRTAEAARRDLHGRSPRVYYEVDEAPYAAGPESFIGELLARLGARNIVTADLGPFPKLNPEYVVRQNPDVIIVAPADVAALANRPGWSVLPAVTEHRICSFDRATRDTLVRPGPRVAHGLRAVAECLARTAP